MHEFSAGSCSHELPIIIDPEEKKLGKIHYLVITIIFGEL
jgi:hypothetical protein